jgi:hypothetical protein
MSYTDYLQTPEWQETERAAVRRAAKQCQGCKATNIALNAYHTSLDNLGCETEDDIAVLCATCYDRLQQKLPGLAENEEEQQDYPDFSFTKKFGIGMGSSLATVGIPIFLHAPLPAELAGVAAAIALAANSPKIYNEVRDYLPSPLVALMDGMAERRQERQEQAEWNTWDKLLGRHLHEQEEENAKEEIIADQSAETAKGATTGPWVPSKFSLDDVLETVYSFNKKGTVYFGNSEDGGVAIPLNEMYHVIDVSSSGKGKSNRFRLGMMQMVGTCTTYCINPVAANVKPVSDEREVEVWKPIYDRLANKRPIKEGSEIKDLLTTLVNEITTRNVLEEQYDFSWQEKPVFVFIDELPEVFARCPEALKLLDKIGRMGRQYCIFLWVASQTANVNDIGLSTPAQAQFKTRIYGGGDKTSAERMMKGSIPPATERILSSNGAGLTLMLADNMGACTFTRSPLVTNEALFEYLGLPPFRKEEWTQRRRPAPLLSPLVGNTREASILPSREGSHTLPNLTVESVTALYTSGKIDQNMFITLLQAVTQPETKTGTRGNALETASQSTPEAQENGVFPVSDKNITNVSADGNSGNSDEGIAETALQAPSERVITGVFPVSTSTTETASPRSEVEKLGVSLETVEHIKMMKEKGYADREISDIVGMRGRKYETYKKVLKSLGYTKEERA